MTSLTLCDFAPGMRLRSVLKDREPWFLAKDACDALGMLPSACNGYGSWLRGLDADEVTHTQKLGMFAGVHPQACWVSESGLYALIFRSRKPEAVAFQDWVCRVVLPAIRKDGMYIKGEENVAAGEMSEDDLIARAWVAVNKKLERIEKQVAEQQPAALPYSTGARMG
jgi:prophage antirepressor-like protein